jgi:hypothetical protein
MANENEKPIEKDQEIITPDGVGTTELSEQELAMVSGGDESPKETVTFEYGALQVHYTQQKPNG